MVERRAPAGYRLRHSLLRFVPYKPSRDFLLAVQPVEFIQLPVAEREGGGYAGDPCDCCHRMVGITFVGRLRPSAGFMRCMLRKAGFEIGKAAFRLAPRAKHRR